MAYKYDGSSQRHVFVGPTPDQNLSDLTISFWARAATLNTSDWRVPFGLASGSNPDSSTPQIGFFACLQSNDVPHLAFISGDGTATSCTGASSFGTGTWRNVIALRTGTTVRCYLDGVQMGSDGTTTTSAIDTNLIWVGGFRSGIFDFGWFDGDVAEIAIWTAALAAGDRAALAKGVSPLCIQPGSLLDHLPLIRSTNARFGSGIGLTATNGTPTVSAHPRIYYPTGPIILPFDAGDAPITYTTEVVVNQNLDKFDSAILYETVVTVSQDLYANSPHKYSTSAEATAFIDGDFSVNPDQGNEVTYTTEVIVNQAYSAGPPILVRYETVVEVDQTLTMSDLVRYTTEVLVKQRHASAIDGRVDLLGNLRYRR